MTTVDERSSRTQRMLVYLAVGIVLGGLLAAGYLVSRSARASAEAEAKADRLAVRLAQEGARSPSRDQLVKLLGTDGGAICADPGAALARASGPAALPALPPETLVRVRELVIEVYCPEKAR
ncbi:hypothetical protein AMES_3852 [Amycolatopsis mediterranei S699]|uniref:DUF732 domain-containing protein n=2 Tax=Amycolatopsis mediterranei TaxID=33910 RepID=A0A0H3D5W5_AMYMU|nr:hypothetical protein [Amycolatopsis mediterranei]ADJ45677.1 hypothetical protein AMED_3898 [Amycolatopsis mediterranei U32]AEK42455.1 hypothetical protein RAM_19845 [Amycolatopsis mediterranei S699]AFO77388.1 hypothetical protein AMES_3852 [Amycolatopsis mediterranei S699]AGT84516.1 hypothetical protein B737_3852 [Amycolatopsis mediterranei RB]KDO05932.1 hypothetical protein DV26_36840 [Amycolatopsis mediterranei]